MRKIIRGMDIKVTQDLISVTLEDNRHISVPVAWYKRLSSATVEQLGNCYFIGDGIMIEWPDFDCQVSVESMLIRGTSVEADVA